MLTEHTQVDKIEVVGGGGLERECHEAGDVRHAVR